MRPILAAAAAALAPLLPAAPAAAHVTLDPPQAQAGATLRAAFRVPHGCAGGAATERLVVTLPEGIVQARPMPKAGWAISIALAPLEAPVDNGHGGVHTHRVAEIARTGGPLPDAHYEEFVVLLRLPPADRAGEALWIPAVQHCAGGATAAWTEVPEPGRRVTDTRHPAPAIRLLPPRTPREGGP
jgi:periplasmic copper chaperone A